MSDKPTLVTVRQPVVEGQPVLLEEFRDYMTAYKEIAPYFDLPNGWVPFPKLLVGTDTAAEFYHCDPIYYKLRGYKPQSEIDGLEQEYLPSCFILCFFQPKVVHADGKTVLEMTEEGLGQPIALATLSMLPSYRGSLKSHHSYFVHDVRWLSNSVIDTTDIDDLNTALKIYSYRYATDMIELVHYNFPVTQLTPWVSCVLSIQRCGNTLAEYIDRYRYPGQLNAVDATFTLADPAPRSFFMTLAENSEQFDFVRAAAADTYPDSCRLEFYRAFLHVISGVLLYVSPTVIQMMTPEQMEIWYHRYFKLAEYYQYKVDFIVKRDDGNPDLPLVSNCILYKREFTDDKTVITIENYWRFRHVDLVDIRRRVGRGLFESIASLLVGYAAAGYPHPEIRINLDLQDVADLQYSFNPELSLCNVVINGLTFDFSRKMNRIVRLTGKEGNEL